MLFGSAWISTMIALLAWRIESSVSLWAAVMFAVTTAVALLYSWATK